MKLLIGLINLIIWWFIPPFLVFIFSFVFFYTYTEVVHSIPFALTYAMYFIGICVAYGTCVNEKDTSMDFIKKN